ncbi:MAG: ribosome maturation factor RimM [Proteobacteria bacterium]|nr:ribosome maturation factor RimM [Pseudomonadota bacterium]
MRSEKANSTKVLVARIGAAHGVRGEMKFWSFTEDPEAVADYGPLETLDGKRSFEIESMRAAKDHFVVRLSGVADRTAAEKLTNTDLYVPRDRLPPIDEDDTYYHTDLIGLAAVTPEGVALGKITGLFNFGAGDLIEITTPQGGEPMLLPFTNAVVPDVDIKGGKITVVLPSIIE